MSRGRVSSLAASASLKQVLDVEDLDPALAHARHELVVLPLRALHPQHVVEQQLVVVVRGEPLQAELGPVDDDLPQLADLRVDAEPRSGWLLQRSAAFGSPRRAAPAFTRSI